MLDLTKIRTYEIIMNAKFPRMVFEIKKENWDFCEHPPLLLATCTN